jgi:hypothetical protein
MPESSTCSIWLNIASILAFYRRQELVQSWCALYALSIEYGRQGYSPNRVRVRTRLEPMTSLFRATLLGTRRESQPKPHSRLS